MKKIMLSSAIIAGTLCLSLQQASAACIITLFGKQYDVTSLRNTHPGGDVFVCGTDQTALYTGKHGTNLNRMQPYLVPTAAPAAVPAPKVQAAKPATSANNTAARAALEKRYLAEKRALQQKQLAERNALAKKQAQDMKSSKAKQTLQKQQLAAKAALAKKQAQETKILEDKYKALRTQLQI